MTCCTDTGVSWSAPLTYIHLTASRPQAGAPANNRERRGCRAVQPGVWSDFSRSSSVRRRTRIKLRCCLWSPQARGSHPLWLMPLSQWTCYAFSAWAVLLPAESRAGSRVPTPLPAGAYFVDAYGVRLAGVRWQTTWARCPTHHGARSLRCQPSPWPQPFCKWASNHRLSKFYEKQ